MYHLVDSAPSLVHGFPTRGCSKGRRLHVELSHLKPYTRWMLIASRDVKGPDVSGTTCGPPSSARPTLSLDFEVQSGTKTNYEAIS
jgi:hypothetical protein